MRVAYFGLGWLLLLAVGADLALSQDIQLGDLHQRCSTICQPADAPWRSVPWQTDLLKAQHLAVEQGKPIFIWAMDGHPLGCT